MPSIFEDHEIHLRDYLYILRKRRRVILIFLLGVISLSIIYTLFEKVLYRATATMLIEPENPNVVDFKEVMALDASNTDYYQTQYQMLKSYTLIQRVIQTEKLAEDPYLKALQRGRLRRYLKDLPWMKSWFGEFAKEKPLAEIFSQKMLKIEPIRNSRLVEISVLHPDSVRSAEMTNRLVELFIKWSLENRFTIHNQATEMISSQLTELKEKVTGAEIKLQNYMEEKHLVNISSIHEQNRFLEDAKLELVKIQSEEAKLAKRYLPEHPKRIHIRSQIEGLEEKIKEEQNKMITSSRVAIEYSQLAREAESASKTYEALLSRLEETLSESKTQASNIVIVDRAVPPARPDKPRPLLNLLVAFFVGSLGGVVLAFFFEYFNSTVKIPDDIEKGLGLDLFGIIPQELIRRTGQVPGEVFFAADKSSPVAESFRALRTALLFKLRHIPGCRVLLVTSPNPGEGKSTITLNLAKAFEQNHLKVLLVDADLRKARLHRILNVEQEKGLSDILEGEVSACDAIRENVLELGFDFLTCGKFSHHPTEILGTQAMQDMLSSLKSSYDLILLDSPPYLPVADVAVLNEHADAVIVVAYYQKTDKRHLRDLNRRFNENGKKVLGVVINQVSVREKDYYFQQYYYYGYGDVGRPK